MVHVSLLFSSLLFSCESIRSRHAMPKSVRRKCDNWRDGCECSKSSRHLTFVVRHNIWDGKEQYLTDGLVWWFPPYHNFAPASQAFQPQSKQHVHSSRISLELGPERRSYSYYSCYNHLNCAENRGPSLNCWDEYSHNREKAIKNSIMMSSGVGGHAGEQSGEDFGLANQRRREMPRHNHWQIQRLEEVFTNNQYPDKEFKKALSKELNLDPKQITDWFGNRRMREKKSDRAQSFQDEDHRGQLPLAVISSPNNAIPAVSPQWVITPEGSASISNFAQRISSRFLENVMAFGGMDSCHFPNVRVSVRPNTEPGIAGGFVVGASASLMLDVSEAILIDFLTNDKTRFQWDISCDESLMKVIPDIYPDEAHSATVSIYQASIDRFILQQSTKFAALRTVIAYVPLHLGPVRYLMSGMDPSHIPILPVGFLISGNDKSKESAAGTSTNSSAAMPARSILMFFFQMCAESGPDSSVSTQATESIKALVSVTMHKIKAAFSG